MEGILSAIRTLPLTIRLKQSIYYFSLSLLSASLLTAAFPPFNLGILAWIGMVPFLFGLRKSHFAGAVALSVLTGLFYFTGTFFWAGSVAVIGVRNWLLYMVLPLSLYFLLFGVIYWLISRRHHSWLILGAPALWVSLEYVRSNLYFLALPWNLLGHSQYQFLPIIQIADVTGVYGISFPIVMVNQFLSQLPELKQTINRRNPSRGCLSSTFSGKLLKVHFLVVFAALTVALTYGWYRMFLPESNVHLRVAIVQPNVLVRDDMTFEDQKKHLNAYELLSKEASKTKPDLIIWSASSLPAPIKVSRLERYTMRRLTSETGCYFLVGGSGYEKFAERKEGYSPYSNSEFLISPFGRVVSQYNKMKLVPFNEYLPLRGKISWPQSIATLQRDFKSGDEDTLFEVKGAKFGTPICWENLFSDVFSRFVRQGANFMVSVTNEGFYGRNAAPLQTLSMNIFRAVENRVPIARAAPTGVSAFINANGEIAEMVKNSNGEKLFVSGYLVKNVALSSGKTFYTAYGDIFAYAVIFIAVPMTIVSLFSNELDRARFRSF